MPSIVYLEDTTKKLFFLFKGHHSGKNSTRNIIKWAVILANISELQNVDDKHN